MNKELVPTRLIRKKYEGEQELPKNNSWRNQNNDKYCFENGSMNKTAEILSIILTICLLYVDGEKDYSEKIC